jgi:hypothetical protein
MIDHHVNAPDYEGIGDTYKHYLSSKSYALRESGMFRINLRKESSNVVNIACEKFVNIMRANIFNLSQIHNLYKILINSMLSYYIQQYVP